MYTYTQGSTTYYGLGPSDFATIYNLLPLWSAGVDGTGQTIAIVGETNIHLSDIATFRSIFGLPAKSSPTSFSTAQTLESAAQTSQKPCSTFRGPESCCAESNHRSCLRADYIYISRRPISLRFTSLTTILRR